MDSQIISYSSNDLSRGSIKPESYRYTFFMGIDELMAYLNPKDKTTICPTCGAKINNTSGCTLCPICGTKNCGE